MLPYSRVSHEFRSWKDFVRLILIRANLFVRGTTGSNNRQNSKITLLLRSVPLLPSWYCLHSRLYFLIDHFFSEYPCASEPCLNGATCNDTDDLMSYFCVCPEAFYGETCEQGKADISHLNSHLRDSLCLISRLHSASPPSVIWCRMTETNFPVMQIICGQLSTLRVPCWLCFTEYPCVREPCLNGGTCQEKDYPFGSYLCICPEDFYGETCELGKEDRLQLQRRLTDSVTEMSHNYLKNMIRNQAKSFCFQTTLAFLIHVKMEEPASPIWNSTLTVVPVSMAMMEMIVNTVRKEIPCQAGKKTSRLFTSNVQEASSFSMFFILQISGGIHFIRMNPLNKTVSHKRRSSPLWNWTKERCTIL